MSHVDDYILTCFVSKVFFMDTGWLRQERISGHGQWFLPDGPAHPSMDGIRLDGSKERPRGGSGILQDSHI